LTASARNSGEYNPFGSRSIFVLQIVNYTIRRTPIFPTYLSRRDPNSTSESILSEETTSIRARFPL